MSIEPVPSPLRLNSLQALRAIAAMLVVIFHGAEIWREGVGVAGFAGPWDRGWAGVDLFFVISGFVMVWVAGDRTAGLRTAVRFLWDRATRVYPLWWVFCALMAAYFFVAYGQPASPATETPDTAWGMFTRSMLLWPQGQMPVLSVGWTLIFEMAFYALFALLLLLPPKWRSVGLGVWAAALLYRWNFSPADSGLPDSWLLTLLDPLCFEFLIGAAVAYWLKTFRLPAALAIGLCALGLGIFIAAMIWLGGVEEAAMSRNRVLAFGLPSGLIVLGVVGWEIASAGRTPGWLRWIGDASYTLYLAHFLLLLALRRVFDAVGLFTDVSAQSMAGFMSVGLIASVVAAMILYRLIERPLLRFARAPLAKRPISRQR